jgi:hypothetical protein
LTTPGTGGRRVPRTLVAVAVLAALAWGAYAWWPSEERRVLRRVDALEDILNEQPESGLALVARAGQLATFVEPDVVFDPGRGAGAIHGRERLMALAARAPNSGGAFAVNFLDASATVNGAQAKVRMTATISWIDARGEENVDAREFELEMRKTDDWRIARITGIDAIEKPQP